jgi:parallel beta-helix repeat protein
LLLASPAAATASTWVVTTSADGGGACTTSSCALRAAIVAANASAGGDLITFAIAPAGQHTITVGAGGDNALPEITGSDVVLDATTQPGGGAHAIRLHDGDTSGTESGLVVAGERVTIRGFAITGFDRYGIYLKASSRAAVVAGNWIGTRDGASDDGMRDDGIHVRGGGGHRLGGTSAADRNVVSGGSNDGIELEDSSDNVVVGNYVGMTADGLGRLPNAGSGIEINGLSFRNRLGGTTASERNVVSGNDGIGIQILGSMRADGSCEAPESNVVAGNYAGLNVNGVKAGTYGNLGAGIEMGVCGRNNTIGGTAPGARNVASGNRDDGIQLDSAGGPGGTNGVCNNVIQGNYAGTSPSGMASRFNADDGIDIDRGSCNNLVGGMQNGAGNLIAGNAGDGIDINSLGSNGNIVQGNEIGLGADGSTTIPNLHHGVHIRFNARNNRVEGNTVSGSGLSGVMIETVSARSNVIRNNNIGTTRDGTGIRGNKEYGVWLYDGTTLNVIEGNIITGSGRDGVAVEQIVGSPTTTKENTIRQNRIFGNGGLGIDLLPGDGVNSNDGTTSSQVANVGLDFPVIARATSSSVSGTAPPGSRVEVFLAQAATGESHGEGAAYVATAVADGTGAWCTGGLSLGGTVTATATDSAGNTSEFAANMPIQGNESLCGQGGTVLFTDDFTGPDGATPANWDVRRSAAGTGAGATIQSNWLRESVVLAEDQAGSWHYVQAREKILQFSWTDETVLFRWQMTTSATSGQSASFVLTPGAAAGNAVSQADYLRIRLENGKLAIMRRTAGGAVATLWSGSVSATSALRDFELHIDATSLSLYEGPAGAAVLRIGPLSHNLAFASGYPYLHASTSSVTPFTALFDNVTVATLPS